MENRRKLGKILFLIFIFMMLFSCGNNLKKVKENSENSKKETGNKQLDDYLNTLKPENDLQITMGGKPVTIVGKETKVGDTLKSVPLTINPKLEEKDILADKAIKVIYTAPSLDTKVCSIQTQMLNDTASKHVDVKFYSVTVDTPFAQERFCKSNGINSLVAASDYRYHHFGLQNGFLIKEYGLLTRALMIVDENNIVKYIEYVKEEADEADVEKAMKFLEEKVINKK